MQFLSLLELFEGRIREIDMGAVIKCPVCGIDTSVDDRCNPSEVIEERYLHRDHYFYLDLPFAYDGGKTRKPKILSDATVEFLKANVREHHLLEILKSNEQFRQTLKQRLEERRTGSDASKPWGYLLLNSVQEIITQMNLDDVDRNVLEDLLWDEGFKLQDGNLVLVVSPISETERRRRSRYIPAMRKLFNEFRDVYTHLYANILCAKSNEDKYVLHAIFVLTPKQKITLGSYSPNTQHVLHLSKLVEIESINELISNIEEGQIVVDGQEYLLKDQRRGVWCVTAISGQQATMESDFDGSEGYGWARKSGTQIIDIFKSLNIDHLDFINEEGQVFTNFGEFSQRVFGTRMTEGADVFVDILFPIWVDIIEKAVEEDGSVTVVWKRPRGFHDKLQPRIICQKGNEPITYSPIDVRAQTQDGETNEAVEFQVDDFEEIQSIDFALLHGVASQINRGKPYLTRYKIWSGPRPVYRSMKRIIEKQRSKESFPNIDEILQSLFPKAYPKNKEDVVSEEELQTLAKLYDNELRQYLLEILSESPAINETEKQRLLDEATKPHGVWEIADFIIHGLKRWPTLTVAFPIKSGRDKMEVKDYEQLTRPYRELSGAVTVIFLAGKRIPGPLESQILKGNKKGKDFVFSIGPKVLAYILKKYDLL